MKQFSVSNLWPILTYITLNKYYVSTYMYTGMFTICENGIVICFRKVNGLKGVNQIYKWGVVG